MSFDEQAAPESAGGGFDAPPSPAPSSGGGGALGTALEAAFVDPAYQWPPPDGAGRNAIELQASVNLMEDSESVRTTESQRDRMRLPVRPKVGAAPPSADQPVRLRWWNCCGGGGGGTAAIEGVAGYEAAKRAALEARRGHNAQKKARARQMRMANRYKRVPEGILIYRLDTATQTLSLVSEPHLKTDQASLLTEMVVASARPSPDKSRRGMLLTGVDGTTTTLVACEQRTAIAWLEAIDLMLANKHRMGDKVSRGRKGSDEGLFVVLTV